MYEQMPHFMVARLKETDEQGREVVGGRDGKHEGADGEKARGNVGMDQRERDARADRRQGDGR